MKKGDNMSSNTMKYGLVLALIIVVAGGYWYLSQPPPVEEPEALKIAVVMWGEHNAGMWDPAAANAVIKLQAEYTLDITWAEQINFNELESLLETLTQTNQVIYLTTDEFEEACKKVATAHPAVYWIQQYENKSIAKDYFPDNVVVLNAYQANEVNFLAGAVSAKLTETGKLGIVQAIAGPRDTRIMSAAFRSGAHYVNDSIEVSRVIIGDYVNAIETRQSVEAFADSGCDIIFVGMDDASGTLEAEEQGIYSIQEYLDITGDHSDTMVGCTVWNWDVGVDMVLDAIVNDNWETFRDKHHQVPLSLEDGGLDIPVWGNMVPQDVQEYAETLKQQIIDGTVEIPDIDEW